MVRHVTTRPVVYAPRGDHGECSTRLRDYVNASLRLGGGGGGAAAAAAAATATTIEIECWNEFVDVEPGTSVVDVCHGRYRVHVYRMDHSVPCVGYGVVQVRRKLRPEYATLDRAAIVELRRRDVDVTHEVETPVVCYLCDTTPAIFDVAWHGDALLRYATVIVECTFLRDTDAERALARTSKHTHWDELWPIIRRTPDTEFVLVHFSMRYSVREIHDFFDAELARRALRNVVVWTN
jgi:ribonuclease Z